MARMVRVVGGSMLLVAGFLMLFLPGPGLLTMAAGLALLARDVPWAGRLSDRIKEKMTSPSRTQ